MNDRLNSRCKERLGKETWPNFVTDLDANDNLGVALGQQENEDLVQVFTKLGPLSAG